MSLTQSDAGAAQDAATLKWYPCISFAGEPWSRVGDKEYETGDEAINIAENVLRALVCMAGGMVVSRGPDVMHECKDGMPPAPSRFQPEMN